MSYKNKVAENKKVAEKCMEIKAYNAGIPPRLLLCFFAYKRLSVE
jgi:hypothetical protein